MFNLVSEDYPDMEFVISNAESKADNVTSVHLNGEAMGFFGGMTAAHMSKTNQIGVIASFKWQPEVDGFIKGAKYENPDITINTKYTDHWDDDTTAVKLYEKIKRKARMLYIPPEMGIMFLSFNKLKRRSLCDRLCYRPV